MLKDRIVFAVLISTLLVACGAFMSPLLGGNFVTDDYHLLRCITYGPLDGTSFEADKPANVLTFFGTPVSERYQLYRPLVIVSIRLSYELSGLDPSGFLWANLILHLVNGLIVALIIKKMMPQSGHLGWSLALVLFALHPFQTQVVAWSAARSDSISFFFGSLALLTKWNQPQRKWLPAILAFLALMSKESAAVWFLVIFAIELIGTKEKRSPSALNLGAAARRSLPLFVFGLIYTYLRWNTLGTLGGGTKYMGEDLGSVVANKGFAYVQESIKFAFAPVSAIVLPDVSDMNLMILKVTQAFTGSGLLVLGLIGLWKRGFLSLFTTLAIILVPLSLILPLSPLGPDYANTRGFYTPLLAFGILLATAVSYKPKIGTVFSLLLILSFLPTSWGLQQRWLESGASIKNIAEQMEEITATLNPKDVDRVVVLNYTRPESNKDVFGFSELSEAQLLRPFVNGDYGLEKVTGDLPVAGRDFLVPLTRTLKSSTDKTAFVEAAFNHKTGDANMRVIHAGTSPTTLPLEVTPISPEAFDKRELRIDNIESRTPRFMIQHITLDEPLRYSIDILACRGLAISLPIAPSKIEVKDGVQTTHIKIPPLPVEMIKNLTIPRLFAWSVTVTKKDGTVMGRSAMRPFFAQLMTK